ncbi:IS1096 element passenger TnpR family protein [Consotaella aegiceratis]|uniref:IS1096 element passenger TnpR family protein n=1 Tax=Consotaella aegiceratis TaxID=3097961 RepID=UPI003D802053
MLPSTTLRELHGIFQVAMGWEGIHLYQFVIRTVRYGSWETGARPANVSLADLKLRRGSRFVYEYDLNIPWKHEVRLEGAVANRQEVILGLGQHPIRTASARNSYPYSLGVYLACQTVIRPVLAE